MSNCCGNPGVGISQKDQLPDPNYDIYNPGEVRLYGRPGSVLQIFTMSDLEIEDNLIKEFINNSVPDELAKKLATAARKVLSLHISKNDILGIAKQRIGFLVSDGVNIYSLSVNTGMELNCCCDDNYFNSIGVIYGYAYEGHCYKLPKPQIMFLPTEAKNILGGDCGCDCGYAPELGYAVWQIDKLERVVALDVRSGDVKTLVLDENMPGNRSPLAYSQSLKLAPQRSHE